MKASDRFFVEGVRCAAMGQSLPVANLSVGGFYAACSQLPVLGEILDLEMRLGERASFKLSGRVSWVNSAPEGRPDALPRGFGVKIIRIAFQDKLAIVDFLKRVSNADGKASDTGAGEKGAGER